MGKSTSLFGILAVLSFALPGHAQTGSLVREDRVWSYSGHFYDEESGWYPAVREYHFNGSREENGKVYMVLRDALGEQVALMRQNGGKVYIYVTEEMKDMMDTSGAFEFMKAEGYEPTVQDEYLLYDFDAGQGNRYWTLVSGFESGEPPYSAVAEAEVTDCYSIMVNGMDYRVQRVENMLYPAGSWNIMVEGVGCQYGLLFSPRLILWMTTGSSASSTIIFEKMTDLEGNVLFEGKDFSTDHVGFSDLKVWEYVCASREGEKVSMTMLRQTTHPLVCDSFVKTPITTWTYTIDPVTGKLCYGEDKQVFDTPVGWMGEIRDESGVVYMKVPESLKDNPVLIGQDEVMLYDFNAKEGDTYRTLSMDLTGDGSLSNPEFKDVTVLETGYTEHMHLNCRIHRLLESSGKEYSIIEGFGREETGIIPYSNVLDFKGGEFSGVRLNRVYFFMPEHWTLGEDDVIWQSPDFIDVNDLAKSGVVENMFGKELGLFSYDGSGVSAAGQRIVVYDMAGKPVAAGADEVSTAALQPGVYIVRAGAMTRKITVR